MRILEKAISSLLLSASLLHSAAHEASPSQLSELFESLLQDTSPLAMSALLAPDDKVLTDSEHEQQLAMINKVCDAGIDINCTDSEGRTALMAAAFRGKSAALVTSLLAKKANPKLADSFGQTALHFYAKNCSYWIYPNLNGECCIAKLLVQANADLTAKDLQGKTPLSIAVDHPLRGYFNTESLLRSGAAVSDDIFRQALDKTTEDGEGPAKAMVQAIPLIFEAKLATTSLTMSQRSKAQGILDNQARSRSIESIRSLRL